MNPKSEIRNPKQIRTAKSEGTGFLAEGKIPAIGDYCFRTSVFGFGSVFGL
jgi:hypothetical protein